MTEQNGQTPAQIYLDIAHKVNDGYEYPIAEAKIDFTRLFHALRQSLSQNSSLTAQLESANQLIIELKIDNTLKDLELFNFTNQIEEKDNK
jgi:hypothetical protein